jgi:hypothetical protein
MITRLIRLNGFEFFPADAQHKSAMDQIRQMLFADD